MNAGELKYNDKFIDDTGRVWTVDSDPEHRSACIRLSAKNTDNGVTGSAEFVFGINEQVIVA